LHFNLAKGLLEVDGLQSGHEIVADVHSGWGWIAALEMGKENEFLKYL
jgi:hypothetical protein